MSKSLSRREALRRIAAAVTAATARPEAIGQVATTLFNAALSPKAALDAVMKTSEGYSALSRNMEIKLGKSLGFGADSALLDEDSDLASLMDDLLNFTYTQGKRHERSMEDFFPAEDISALPPELKKLGAKELAARVRAAFSPQEWTLYERSSEQYAELLGKQLSASFKTPENAGEARPNQQATQADGPPSDETWLDSVHGRGAALRNVRDLC